MKKIVIFIITLFLINVNSYSEIIETRHFEKVAIEAAKSLVKFANVYIVCELEVCRLSCYDQGENNCSFDVGFNDPRSCACVFERVFFDEGNGQDMFDYADNQIDNDDYEGTYSNNLIISENVIIYRTVDWSYDELIDQRNINLVMPKVTAQ